MKYKYINNTNLNVSSLCLGSGDYGVGIPKNISFDLMDTFIFNGGNFIDTANIYGQWADDGLAHSEIVIGEYIKSKPRNSLILATKGAHYDLNSSHIPRLNKEDVYFDTEQSLKNLQTEYIDLYYLHRDDESIAVEYIIDYMNELINSGKIRYYGCSNWKTSRIIKAQEYAKSMNLQGFSINQMNWSLAHIDKSTHAEDMIDMDNEMYDMHINTSLSVATYSSQAKGLFAKILYDDFYSEKYKNLRKAYINDITTRRIDTLKEYYKNSTFDLNQLALGYLINQPFTTIPIIGCRTVNQLLSSLKADNVYMPVEITQKLFNI